MFKENSSQTDYKIIYSMPMYSSPGSQAIGASRIGCLTHVHFLGKHIPNLLQDRCIQDEMIQLALLRLVIMKLHSTFDS